jgi:hypothetical protein
VDNNAENIAIWISSPLIGLKKIIIAAKKSDKPAKRPNNSRIIPPQA